MDKAKCRASGGRTVYAGAGSNVAKEAVEKKRGGAFEDGQGTLAPQTGSWHNELHPAKAGFEKFADIFQQRLKVLFPDRVA
jgi:hypothetical protein